MSEEKSEEKRQNHDYLPNINDDHHTRHVLLLSLNQVLTQLCHLNANIPMTPYNATRFHASTVPVIPILDYLKRYV